MNKKQREILDQIEQKREAFNKAEQDGASADELRTIVNEKKALEDKLAMINDMDVTPTVTDRVEPMAENDTLTYNKAFIQALKADAKRTTKDKAVLEAIRNENLTYVNESNPAQAGISDGEYLVPYDVDVTIQEFRRQSDALVQYVTVENVSSLKGSRVFEANADEVPFDNVEEAEIFPEIPAPDFARIEYTVQKKGGILKATKEILEDTDFNLQQWLAKWLGKKFKVTDNFHILQVLEANKGEVVSATQATLLDAFKDAINIEIDPALSNGSVIFTNQSGFNMIDKMKAEDGSYVVQADVTGETKRLLFGKYPIVVVSDKTLKNDESTGTPFFVGNIKEAVIKFDRNVNTISVSDVAGDLWERDMLGFKPRMRADYRIKDADAYVKIEVAPSI